MTGFLRWPIFGPFRRPDRPRRLLRWPDLDLELGERWRFTLWGFTFSRRWPEPISARVRAGVFARRSLFA